MRLGALLLAAVAGAGGGPDPGFWRVPPAPSRPPAATCGFRMEPPWPAPLREEPWLVAAQDGDGGWWPHPARRVTEVGRVPATCHALLALLGSGTAHPGGAWEDVADRGVDWLGRRQDAGTGRIGGGDAEHALATLVLAEWSAARSEPRSEPGPERRLRRAVEHLAALDLPSGRGSRDAWAAAAWLVAARAGVPAARARAGALVAWATEVLSAEGETGPDALAAAAAAALVLATLDRDAFAARRARCAPIVARPPGAEDGRELDRVLLTSWAAFVAGGRDLWRPWSRHLDAWLPAVRARYAVAPVSSSRPLAAGGPVAARAIQTTAAGVALRGSTLAVLW